MFPALLKKPRLSIVVVFFNMRREAARTLYTLGTGYQRGVTGEDYEVLAIDNGSGQPLDAGFVTGHGVNFRYENLATGSKSPAGAVNHGVAKARGKNVAVIVDGARMVTPGIIRESIRAVRSFSCPFVCTLGWHLGPDVQNRSMLQGYDQLKEDSLLDSIDWRRRGYRLFEISTLAQSSGRGFLGGMPSECSWFAMPRSGFEGIGGYDERFQSPGGGQVNHDFLGRVAASNEFEPVILLGEGSFHQFHGGVATNVPLSEHPSELFKAEHMRIHGKPVKQVWHTAPYYMGKVARTAHRFFNHGILEGNG